MALYVTYNQTPKQLALYTTAYYIPQGTSLINCYNQEQIEQLLGISHASLPHIDGPPESRTAYLKAASASFDSTEFSRWDIADFVMSSSAASSPTLVSRGVS